MRTDLFITLLLLTNNVFAQAFLLGLKRDEIKKSTNSNWVDKRHNRNADISESNDSMYMHLTTEKEDINCVLAFDSLLTSNYLRIIYHCSECFKHDSDLAKHEKKMEKDKD